MSLALELSHKIKKLVKKWLIPRVHFFLAEEIVSPSRWKVHLSLKKYPIFMQRGYASGEMKHGPIALVDDKVPVVIIAPMNSLFEKNFSNMQEILARGGKVILITDEKGNSKDKFKKN